MYCDVCNRRVMPITDADFVEGKAHVYYVPTGAEPAKAEPTTETLTALLKLMPLLWDDIEIIIKTQRKRISSTEYLGVNSVNLCKVCLDGMLELNGMLEDLICNPTIDDD